MPGKRLSFEERQFISAARGEGLSLRAIGRELGRPHTTISREIHRNLMTLGRNRVYRSTVAEHRTRVRAKRPKVFKLQRNRRLARVVERLLAGGGHRDRSSGNCAKTIPMIHAGGCLRKRSIGRSMCRAGAGSGPSCTPT